MAANDASCKVARKIGDNMANWQPATLVSEDGILELWACECHNGYKFGAGSKEEAEQNRANYYTM